MTVMREIISAVVNTSGRIGSEDRQYGFEYEATLFFCGQCRSLVLGSLRGCGSWVLGRLGDGDYVVGEGREGLFRF